MTLRKGSSVSHKVYRLWGNGIIIAVRSSPYRALIRWSNKEEGIVNPSWHYSSDLRGPISYETVQ